jgi:hypothetical protein
MDTLLPPIDARDGCRAVEMTCHHGVSVSRQQSRHEHITGCWTSGSSKVSTVPPG